jgi:predicted nucleotidyltransferase/DNA-binding HxlR family transcriptional regulator
VKQAEIEPHWTLLDLAKEGLFEAACGWGGRDGGASLRFDRQVFSLKPSFTTFVVKSNHMLDLRSKARQRLLAYYFTNPTARRHLRDLAHRLSIDPANLSKELRRLEREGLFQSEVSGRQKYFQLNREYPLFDEVRGIVTKTIGVAPLIAESLKKIDNIEEAYLYGSFANNQQDAASDIDLLIIGDPDGGALAKAMEKLERELEREINYTILTRREFELRRSRKDAFIENVWRKARLPLLGAA